ncbi:Uncharacterised protein [[Flavobacterium] thermophilum]|nr:hypothetical protein GARCT_02056 [Geobacillus sp. 12AMOR1]STO12465.1 Uncharacterised protein [[Flavobacterium] thermophilum]
MGLIQIHVESALLLRYETDYKKISRKLAGKPVLFIFL